MEDNPDDYDSSTVTPIPTESVEFSSEDSAEGIQLPLNYPVASVYKSRLDAQCCPDSGREADFEILKALALDPRLREQVLDPYLKKWFQLSPSPIIGDGLQSHGLSTVPEYRDAVNQAEPVNDEVIPIDQSTPVGEDHNIDEAGLSYNDWYQLRAADTFQAPYFSRPAPQSGLELMAPVGDEHLVNEEQPFYQAGDEAATITITQTSSCLLQAQGSVLSTDERNDYEEPSLEGNRIEARSKRERGAGHSQVPSRHRPAPRSVTKVLPKKEHNNLVERPHVQVKTNSKTGRPLISELKGEVSRLHFYVLEERGVWRKGDRLHIPVYSQVPKNQKNSVEEGTVIMTYISRSNDNKRVSLWTCRYEGVKGGYIPISLLYFPKLSVQITHQHVK